jgi:hypothetical protein
VLAGLVLLLLPLLYLLFRHIRFEKARQAESDTGPSGMASLFARSDDDEEESGEDDITQFFTRMDD